MDLLSGVAVMKPTVSYLEGSGGASGASGASGANSPLLEGNRTGHRKRCQDIITTPRRFMHMEDGLVCVYVVMYNVCVCVFF
jgi:hypothetical protein